MVHTATDRREGQPTQPTKAQQPDSVPLAPVMAPRPSSFSRVGENERMLAEALGKSTIGIDKYIEDKKPEWELEGQMKYAEGAAEKDVVDSGNRFTTAGYMTMKARTAGNAFMENALNGIEQGDNQLDSPAYQKKLSQQYKELTQSTAGKDPFTRNLMGSMASDIFPKLVAQQVKSNNTFKEQQTFDSYKGMLVSEANKFDPSDLKGENKAKTIAEIMAPEVSGLSAARHNQAISESIEMGLKVNDPTLFNAFGVTEKEKIATLDGTQGIPKGGLAYVMATESAGQELGADGKILQGPMTKYGTAKGSMQVLDSTTTSPGYGVTPAKSDTSEERARVGRDYLAAMTANYGGDFRKGLAAYHAGPGNVDTAIQAAGPNGDWLSQLGPKTQAYVNGFKPDENTPRNSDAYVNRAATMVTLLKAGFKPAQVESIQKSFDDYQTRKVNEFDKERTLVEQSISTMARTEGNLPKVLDAIGEKVKVYGAKWGDREADKARVGVTEFAKEEAKLIPVRNAIATHSIAILKAEQQEQAIDMEKARISETIKNDPSIPNDKKPEAIRQLSSQMLIENNVIDHKWKRGINAALTGNIMNKDGTVKPESLQAYSDIHLFASKANPAYADKYLDDAKDIVAMAQSYDADGYSTPQALVIAHEQLNRAQQGTGFVPKLDTEKLKEAASAEIDRLDAGFFSPILKGQAADFMDIRDDEIQRAKASPIIQSLMLDYATRAALLNPNLNPVAAVNKARMELSGRMELVMGNPVVGGKQSSIREDMGMESDTSTNAVGKAMLVFLHDKGEKRWGAGFNKFQYGGNDPNPITGVGSFVDHIKTWFTGLPSASAQSIEDKFRGVPDALIQYDASSKLWIIDPWANKERTLTKGDPWYVPADVVGAYYIARKTPTNNK
jgi:hypothetical protein